MNWRRVWMDTYTADAESERKLIVVARLAKPSPSFFASSDVPPNSLNRIGLPDLKNLYGRAPLVRCLTRLMELDALLSREAGLPTSLIMAHAQLYGADEMAHTPSDRGPSFISVNIGHRRVREILANTMLGCPIAMAVLADLYTHEKAHAAHAVRAVPASHSADFYNQKNFLKGVLLGSLQENPRRDPFRRARYKDRWLHSVEEIKTRFSQVCPTA